MFLFPEHQERYEQFLKQDGTHPKDWERQALFYIFSGYKDLGDRIEHFYDFESRMIRPEAFQAVDLTSGSRALAELAFNLYNNYECGTIVDLFVNLDERNRRLAVEAIKLRFGVEKQGREYWRVTTKNLLVMLPLMHTQGSRFERAVEALQLADTGEREEAIQFIKTMAGKLLSGDANEQVAQVFGKAKTGHHYE